MIEILFIILGAVVCLTAIFGGMALIMRIAEHAYAHGLAKTDSTIEFGITQPIVTEALSKHAITPYAFSMQDKYQGKFVAVSAGRKKKVIAFGTRYRRVVKEAKGLAEPPFSIMFAPKKGVLYTR